MKDKIKFFLGFLLNPRANASIIPSSSKLAKSMVDGIDFEKIEVVVELGPGTGVFTAEILNKVKPGTKVIVIELQKQYTQHLTEKFGDKIIVENDTADNMDKILEKYNIKSPDLIISGLGFVSFPKKLLDSVQKKIKFYTDKGTIFRTFTYGPKIFEKKFENMSVKKFSGPIWNFPLAYVYTIN